MQEDRDLNSLPESPNAAVLASMLLVLCKNKKGLKMVREMREHLDGELLRSMVIPLRGARPSKESVEQLANGVRMLDEVLRRGGDKSG